MYTRYLPFATCDSYACPLAFLSRPSRLGVPPPVGASLPVSFLINFPAMKTLLQIVIHLLGHYRNRWLITTMVIKDTIVRVSLFARTAWGCDRLQHSLLPGTDPKLPRLSALDEPQADTKNKPIIIPYPCSPPMTLPASILLLLSRSLQVAGLILVGRSI